MRRRTGRDHEHPGSGGALATLPAGYVATVCAVCPELDPGVAARLADLGFHEGAVVERVRTAPLGDPTIYRVADTEVCLRRAQAGCILVHPPQAPVDLR